MLEHVAEPCGFMEEAFRILRPGGLVFTALPIQYFSPGLAAKDLALHNRFLFGHRARNVTFRYIGQFHITLFGREGVKDAYGQGVPAEHSSHFSWLEVAP